MLAGERLYIHCWGGHGRTGTLVATMLGRLYSLSCSNALRYTQVRRQALAFWARLWLALLPSGSCGIAVFVWPRAHGRARFDASSDGQEARPSRPCHREHACWSEENKAAGCRVTFGWQASRGKTCSQPETMPPCCAGLPRQPQVPAGCEVATDPGPSRAGEGAGASSSANGRASGRGCLLHCM